MPTITWNKFNRCLVDNGFTDEQIEVLGEIIPHGFADRLRKAALGIQTHLYAGTKHTTITELRQEFDRQAVMDHGTGHRSEAFAHYDHSDGTREALEMREAYDRMRLKVVGKD